MPDLSRVREILKSGRAPAGSVPAAAGAAPAGTTIDHEAVAARLGGALCENEAGRYVQVRSRLDAQQIYGDAPVAAYDTLDAEGLRVLGGTSELPGGDGPVLFVDLETTGLSGGAGTVAFLVGVGFFGGGHFHVNQYVLTSLGAERALLAAVGEAIRASRALVSFNGKSFDVPVMETRWAMHRMAMPWADLQHVDLLHPARRLWRRHDCRLTALEAEILRIARAGDVPGSEIPARYVGYLRLGDAAPLLPVLEHNQLDLMSLAALTGLGCRLVARGAQGATGADQCVALGGLYERAGRIADAVDCYRAVAESEAADVPRAEALYRLALRLRRSRQYEAAAGRWEQILRLQEAPARIARDAVEALAIHHEHRGRDLARATAFARRALQGEEDPKRRDAVRHRLARLDRKQSGFFASGLRPEPPRGPRGAAPAAAATSEVEEQRLVGVGPHEL